MGNTLCKEQTGAGPSDNSNMFGCLHICPSRGSGKKDHNWNKHIYETRPPLPIRHQPPSPTVPSTDETGWKTITLTRPVENGTSTFAPVAPPRKKRTSMLSLKNAGSVKNGFKDVFGSDTPRRYSIDSIHNSKRYKERSVDVPVRNSVSCHDVCDDSFADFSRDLLPKDDGSRKVLPKVGNKKSDKILGENLSDLSIGQPEIRKSESDHDPIEQFVEENVAEKKTVVADQKEATHNKSSSDITIDESVAMKEKAALLMNILNRYSEEPDYSNREPVVEEVIVPRKKKTGHICDEDDFHKHFHKHEKHENERSKEDLKAEDLESMIVIPKKPQRDLSIYRKSLENVNVTAEVAPVLVAPVRRKKSLNRDDMPSPPPRPIRAGIVDVKSQENLESLSPAKDLELAPPSLVLNLSSEKVKPESVTDTATTTTATTTPPPSPIVPARINHEKQASVSESPSSPLIEPSSPTLVAEDEKQSPSKSGKKHTGMGLTFNQDALTKMKQRVLDFQMSHEYVMEDISNENDGSYNVNPTKTLDPVTKKISVASMQSSLSPDSPSVDSPIEEPITMTRTKSVSRSTSKDSTLDNKSELDSQSTSDTLSNDGSGSSTKTIVQSVVQKKIEDKKDITVLPAEESLFNQSSILLAEKSVEDILTSDVNMQVLSNVLNDMYDKSVLEEFQNYLDAEGTDFDDKRKLPVDNSDALIKDLKILRNDKMSTGPQSPVIEEVEFPEPPPAEEKQKKKRKKAKKETVDEDQVSMESISDDEYTELVAGTPKEEITNNALLAVAQTRPRRESIVDVDSWFNNHEESAPPSTLNVDNLRDVRMMRRGSDFMVGYDTNATFPFGRSRHDSESSEFFEKNHFSKSNDNLKGSNSSLNKGSNGSLNLGSNGSLNKDHSSLLRFVVQSPLAAAEGVSTPPPNKTVEEIKNGRNKKKKKKVFIEPPTIEIVITPGDGDEDESNDSQGSVVAAKETNKE